MKVTKKPNGTSIYFYTNKSKRESQIAAVIAGNPKLSRRQRRKINRAINKKLGSDYIE